MHVYRVQALLDTVASDPLDITNVNGITPGSLSVVTGPLADCFTIDPPGEIGPLAAGETVTVTLTNGCAQPVTVGGFPLRLGSAAWSVTAPAVPLAIPTGGTSTFTVAFDPQPGDARDDVLFVQITAPAVGRRPLTLRGAGP
ncbi:MAG: hypothetical protein QM820_38010 [Minicystis sp.]